MLHDAVVLSPLTASTAPPFWTLNMFVVFPPKNMLLIVLMVVQLLHWCCWWARYAKSRTACSPWPGTPATFSCPEYRLRSGWFLNTPCWAMPLESKDRGQTAGFQAVHKSFRYLLAMDSRWFDDRRSLGSLVVLHGIQPPPQRWGSLPQRLG